MPMDESRGRFVESAKMILDGLERGYCEFDGTYVRQPRRDIRPAPFKTFRGRTFAAAVSPDSMPIMAQLGVGLLVIPQKPWDSVREDFKVYHRVWADTHGADSAPPAPMCGGFLLRGRERRPRGRDGVYLYRQLLPLRDEPLRVSGQATLRRRRATSSTRRCTNTSTSAPRTAPPPDFVRLMPFGTPQQVIEKVEFIHETIGTRGLMTHFAYGGMPYDEANRNMRLFVDRVSAGIERPGGTEGGVAGRGRLRRLAWKTDFQPSVFIVFF